MDGFYWMSSTAGVGFDRDLDSRRHRRQLRHTRRGAGPGREAQGRGKTFEQALKYLAEAQSAVRRGLQRLDISNDTDQENVHEWIRSTAARQRIYLGRHMRADDLADPAGWSVAARAHRGARSSGHKTPLQSSPARSHPPVMQNGSERASKASRTGRGLWRPLPNWSLTGCPPATRELRELLLPIIDDVPDMDEHAAGLSTGSPGDRSVSGDASPSGRDIGPPRTSQTEVKEVARLLGGSSVVLIGGIRRRECPADSQAIVRARFAALDRDQGAPVGRDLRTPDCAPGCRLGSSRHPLVEPWFRRGSPSLRAT